MWSIRRVRGRGRRASPQGMREKRWIYYGLNYLYMEQITIAYAYYYLSELENKLMIACIWIWDFNLRPSMCLSELRLWELTVDGLLLRATQFTICMYVCIYIYIYMYTYIHTYTHNIQRSKASTCSWHLWCSCWDRFRRAPRSPSAFSRQIINESMNVALRLDKLYAVLRRTIN